MANAAGNRAVRSDTEVADPLVVFVPQAALVFAEIFERENGAGIVSFERVKHLAGSGAAAETGNGDANGGGVFWRAAPKHHVRKEFFTVTAHFPGMALL